MGGLPSLASTRPHLARPVLPKELQEHVLGDAQYLIDQVRQRSREDYPLPPVQALLLQTDDVIVQVRRIVPSDRSAGAFIDVSAGFLGRLLGLVMSTIEALKVALEAPILESPVAPTMTDDSGFHAWRFAAKFVVCHELSHLICGHLDYWTDVQEHAQEAPPDDYTLLRELDADGTAIRLVTGYLRSRTPLTLGVTGLGARVEIPRVVEELGAEHRVIAFRLCLVSSWLALGALESPEEPEERPSSYPAPATRLVNLISMLFLAFHRIPVTVGEDGMLKRSVDSAEEAVQHIEALGSFVQSVVAPAFAAAEATGPSHPMRRMMRISRHGAESDTYLQSKHVALLLLGDASDASTSIAASEMKRMTAIRHALEDKLKRYRYWNEATLA